MKLRASVLLVTLLALAALTAVPASAAAPPKGKYGCSISGTGFAGNLKVMSGNRYRVNKSKVGRFKMKKGNKMRFPSGVYKGLYRGFWHKTNDGRAEIELTSLESGFTSTYCILEKKA